MMELVLLTVLVCMANSQALLDIPQRHKENDADPLARVIRTYADELLSQKVKDLQSRASSTDNKIFPKFQSVLCCVLGDKYPNTKYKIVYFQAWNTVTLTDIAANTVLVYDKVNSNKGEGYDSSTGEFKAPRGGPYVTWTAVTQDQYSLNVDLYVNEKNIGTAQADGVPGPQNSSGSNTVVLNLKEGDVVTLRVQCWTDRSKRQFYGTKTSVSTFAGWTL